jgi:hypothetical protein
MNNSSHSERATRDIGSGGLASDLLALKQSSVKLERFLRIRAITV